MSEVGDNDSSLFQYHRAVAPRTNKIAPPFSNSGFYYLSIEKCGKHFILRLSICHSTTPLLAGYDCLLPREFIEEVTINKHHCLRIQMTIFEQLFGVIFFAVNRQIPSAHGIFSILDF